jgi:hypothetical protein
VGREETTWETMHRRVGGHELCSYGEDRIQWRVFVNMVMKLQVSLKAKKFLD